MEPLLLALQQRLEELAGEDVSRGFHVVLVRESWLEPDHFRSQEPSPAAVAGLEKSLLPTQTMQERVERMCTVGSCWPLCLARALQKRRDAERPHEREERSPDEQEYALLSREDQEADYWNMADPYCMGANYERFTTSGESSDDEPDSYCMGANYERSTTSGESSDEPDSPHAL